MAKLFKNYVALFVFSGLLFIFGVIALPPLKILALGLLAYLSLFLFKKLSGAYSVMFVVLLSEFVIISLISAGLILSQFELIAIDGVCRVIGLSLWIHSLAALIGEYHAAYVRSARRTPPYVFVIHLALASFGMYMLASPFLSDTTISWIVSVTAFISGSLSLIFAIIFASSKRKPGLSNAYS